MSWSYLQLGDIVSISKGKKHETTEEGIRYLQIEDLRDNLNIKYTNDTNTVLVNLEDIIIVWDGAYSGLVSYGLRGAIGSTLARLKILHPDVFTPFLGKFLQSKLKTIQYSRTGATIPHVNKNALCNLQIPLPPLEEQKRIAAILDKADEIRQKRKKAIALTEELLRSTFLDMFGDPVTNPKGWEIVKLGSQMEELKYGTNSKSKEIKEEGDIPVLRIPNIVGEKISWDNLKYSSIDSKEILKLLLKKGDLLFVRSNGNPEYIGRCALFEEENMQVAYASYLIRGRLKKDSKFNSAFIRDIISFPSFRSRLTNEARTTAGNYNINTKRLSSLKLICPPFEKQNCYLNWENKINYSLKKQKSALENTNKLFNSLLQKAFRGEL